MSAIDYLAPAMEDVKSYFARFGYGRGVKFVPGFFEATMEPLRGRTWSLIRLDADSYNATRLALEALYPGLSVGGYLMIDDYFHLQLPVCRRAVDDFRAGHAITEPIERIDWTGARWRATPHAAVPGDSIRRAGRRPLPRPRAAAQRTGRKLPSDRELELQDEAAALEARLGELGGRARRAQESRVLPRAARAPRRARRGGS